MGLLRRKIMAKLVGYAMMSANKNAIDEGHLAKAMCEFCGKKFLLYFGVRYIINTINILRRKK